MKSMMSTAKMRLKKKPLSNIIQTMKDYQTREKRLHREPKDSEAWQLVGLLFAVFIFFSIFAWIANGYNMVIL